MAVKVGMPNLGHTMETGKVVEWLVPVGAGVSRGDPIAVVESDKVSMEVEAPASGTLLAQVAELQAEIPVGATIALVGAPGEAIDLPPTRATAPRTGPAATARAQATDEAPRPAPPRILASPLARSTAARLGLALDAVPGTGPDGLVVRADVERIAGAGRQAGVVVARPTAARRRIAERMARAWREIPMVPLTRMLDLEPLAAARRALGNPSWTALVARAVALALPAHPRLNAWYRDDAIHACARIDLAIAVALEDDLAVPVIRDAGRLGLDAIAAGIESLATRARAGTLPGDAQADGTFTISNLGGLGVDSFQPIVNPPQVAILGLGRVRAVEGRASMAATLVFDHRALDGADGARFLADLDRRLGDPAALAGPPADGSP